MNKKKNVADRDWLLYCVNFASPLNNWRETMEKRCFVFLGNNHASMSPIATTQNQRACVASVYKFNPFCICILNHPWMNAPDVIRVTWCLGSGHSGPLAIHDPIRLALARTGRSAARVTDKAGWWINPSTNDLCERERATNRTSDFF
jgi:hypothetical protein